MKNSVINFLLNYQPKDAVLSIKSPSIYMALICQKRSMEGQNSPQSWLGWLTYIFFSLLHLLCFIPVTWSWLEFFGGYLFFSDQKS